MAINPRIKAPPSNTHLGAYKTMSPNAYNYCETFWEHRVPQLLEEIKLKNPKLHAGLTSGISWDRQVAGIVWYLLQENDRLPALIEAHPKDIKKPVQPVKPAANVITKPKPGLPVRKLLKKP